MNKRSYLEEFQNLFQRVTADSVSCGALALFAIAMGVLVFMMQLYSNTQPL